MKKIDQIIADDITLVITSDFCPEQYDAFLGKLRVGYLRLRHSHFTVECPYLGKGSSLVYSVPTHGDGCFNPEERDPQLHAAKKSIASWLNETFQIGV